MSIRVVNPDSVFTYSVDTSMRFGIRAMGGEIGGDVGDALIYHADLVTQFPAHALHLLRKHLLTLGKNLELVLGIFRINAKRALNCRIDCDRNGAIDFTG